MREGHSGAGRKTALEQVRNDKKLLPPIQR